LDSFGIAPYILRVEKLRDVGDIVRTIVDSTVTARMKRSKVVDNANIKQVM
jgi:phosphoribosylformylglycinamidine cyclo-ligase